MVDTSISTSAIVVNGRVVTVDSGSEGAAVLLLHGFPETRATWRFVAPELSKEFHVVAPDPPGYGGSERLGNGPQGFDKALVAEQMIALMKKFGHDQFAVVGHDRGGLVTFRAALDHPDVVTHLGVLDILSTVGSWAAFKDLPERMIGAAQM